MKFTKLVAASLLAMAAVPSTAYAQAAADVGVIGWIAGGEGRHSSIPASSSSLGADFSAGAPRKGAATGVGRAGTTLPKAST